MDRVIEGAYEVVGVFDRIEEKRDAVSGGSACSAPGKCGGQSH
ncbi:hypothetical protein [Escherichia coli]